MCTILFPLDSFDAPTGGGVSALLLITRLNSQHFTPLAIFPTPCQAVELLRSAHIQTEIWPLHENHGVGRYIWDIGRSLIFLKQHKIRLIHFNHLGYWKPAEIIAATMLNIPIITHLRLIHKETSPFIRHSQVIIANSMFTGSASAVPQDKVRVVYNAVDLERFDRGQSLRTEFGIAEEELVVGFIGNLQKIKGVEMFIELAATFQQSHARFIIAGGCNDPAYLEQLRNKMQGISNLLYLGYRSDVENIYHTVDLVVMPSQWDEPFGRITIEAGAAKKPIISTRVGGIPEIIEHGENGYLVDKDDFHALARYTTRLLQDVSLRTRLGVAGRANVEAKFTIAHHLQNIETIYRELLAMPR